MANPMYEGFSARTPKDRVKAAHPQAVCKTVKGARWRSMRIYDGVPQAGAPQPPVLGRGSNVLEAWADAASRLPAT